MRRGNRAWAIIAVVATGAGLSLLIWAKLKVVASVPRSAYAEPEQVHPVQTPPTPDAAVVEPGDGAK